MLFTDIRIQHYRSYDDASFDLGPGVSIVVGPNGAGKTNLLEAIMVAAIGKSYRAREQHLIQSGSDWARVDVHTSDNQTRVTKIIRNGDVVTKQYEIDDKPYKRFPGQHKQPVVLFEPTHLNLLHQEPSVRRTYFDDVIEQQIPGYDRLRAQYRRILSQRNALLKHGFQGDRQQLFAWNVRLVDVATQIVSERLNLVEQINIQMSQTYSSIANKQHTLELVYETKQDPQNYSSSLMKRLEQEVSLDEARGFTGSGPHRDDFSIIIDGRPAASTASRGEIRTLILSLKIIELKLLEEKIGKRPLLLLDDVFSELDGARRRALTEFLKEYQTLITTTDADVVLQNFTEDCTLIAL